MTDAPGDLASWLRAQLDADEALALGCPSRDWIASDATVRGGPRVQTAGAGPYMSRIIGEPFPDTVAVPLPHEPHPDDFWTMVNLHGTTGKFESETRVAKHIARWDPVRVLAEIDAKRRILERHAPVVITTGGLGERTVCGQCGEASDEYLAKDWPCETVRLLAAPYAGRLGWQDGWAVA